MGLRVQAALYFPVIRGRLGEIRALRLLSPYTRARIAPVVDLPQLNEASPATLEEHVGSLTSLLASAWGTRFPLYVDLKRYAPSQVDRRGRHVVEHLFDCARQVKLRAIPVSGTLSERGPEPTYLDAVAKCARRGSIGAALRITHADYSDVNILGGEIAAGLERLGLPASQVDLLLDAESIALMPAEQASEGALLSTLCNAVDTSAQHDFRSIVFVGSSIPENLGSTEAGKPRVVTRTELRVWLRYLATPATRLVRFGDTGVWNPRQPDPGQGGGGAPPARVRLPLGDRQVFFRGESSGYRDLCREALEYDGVRDLSRCAGLDEIASAARGSGGVGSATDWVSRDTNVHLEITARQIEASLRRHDRLKAVELAEVQSEPWQQTHLEVAEPR